VSNDHGRATNHWERLVSDILQRAVSDVVYYDGQRARVVAEGLSHSNGVAGSRDGKKVRAEARQQRRPVGPLAHALVLRWA